MLFIKKFGWGQAGQGQRNVTMWKLVSWNVKGFQGFFLFFFMWCMYCSVFYNCGNFVRWGIEVIVVVVLLIWGTIVEM